MSRANATWLAPGQCGWTSLPGHGAPGHLRQPPVGELAALRKEDINLETCTVHVARPIIYLPGGGHSFGPAKSRAGVQEVAFADFIVPDLREHLDQIDDPAALTFTSPAGLPLRHSNFYHRGWMPALKLLGLIGIHFQDLRHTGNQLTTAPERP